MEGLLVGFECESLSITHCTLGHIWSSRFLTMAADCRTSFTSNIVLENKSDPQCKYQVVCPREYTSYANGTEQLFPFGGG